MTDVQNPTTSGDERTPQPGGGGDEPRMGAQLALFVGLLVFVLVGLAGR